MAEGKVMSSAVERIMEMNKKKEGKRYIVAPEEMGV